MSKNELKAIIWDMGGVLWDAVCGSYLNLLTELLEVPEEDIIRVMTSPENRLWDLGEMSNSEFYDFVIKDIGLPPEKKEALNSISIDDFYYDKELLKYIKGLKNRYTIAILTNADRESFEMGQREWPELFQAFEIIIPSFEVKLLKPDPGIYQLALDRVGCKAEEAVFIDDSKTNVAAAEELGIHGIVFENREQIIRDLDSLIAAF